MRRAGHGRWVRLLFVLGVWVWGLLTADAQDVQRVGILSLPGADYLLADWDNVVEQLRACFPEWQFEAVSLPYPDLLAAARKKQIQFAILDPLVGVQLSASHNWQILAQSWREYNGKRYSGCAATVWAKQARADLRKWGDLENVVVGLASYETLGGWRAVQRELRDIRWRGREYVAKDYSTLLDALQAGKVDVAVLPAGMYETWCALGVISQGVWQAIERVPNSYGRGGPLPIEVSTRVYPDWLFLASPSVSEEVQRKVASSLFAMVIDSGRTSFSKPTVVGWVPLSSDLELHRCLMDLRLPPYERGLMEGWSEALRRQLYVLAISGAIAVVGIATSITLAALNRSLRDEVKRRRETENALRKSIERFEHIAACSSDWIWECDERGIYTYVNPSVRPMLGYDVAEVLGRHHMDFLASMERRRLEAEGRTILDGGRRVFREVYRLRTKDGRVVMHEITAEAVRDADGRVIGYRGVNRDISERAHALRLDA